MKIHIKKKDFEIEITDTIFCRFDSLDMLRIYEFVLMMLRRTNEINKLRNKKTKSREVRG